jgi:lipid-binding SYLF domain-containing protein
MRNSRRGILSATLGVCSLLLALAGCAIAPKSQEGRAAIETAAHESLALAVATDPSLKPLLDEAAGYAVFPRIGKGAVGIGGAYGKGVLFEGGRIVGYCDLTQASIGLQLGGQAYTEIVTFETSDVVHAFKRGRYNFDARVSAVALRSGVGAAARYTDGVAVFTMDESGFMFEASLGGQRFDFQPK